MAYKVGQLVQVVDGLRVTPETPSDIIIQGPMIVGEIRSELTRVAVHGYEAEQLRERGYSPEAIYVYWIRIDGLKRDTWVVEPWIRPIDDSGGAEKAEWTEDLRKLCGLKEKADETERIS